MPQRLAALVCDIQMMTGPADPDEERRPKSKRVKSKNKNVIAANKVRGSGTNRYFAIRTYPLAPNFNELVHICWSCQTIVLATLIFQDHIAPAKIPLRRNFDRDPSQFQQDSPQEETPSTSSLEEQSEGFSDIGTCSTLQDESDGVDDILDEIHKRTLELFQNGFNDSDGETEETLSLLDENLDASVLTSSDAVEERTTSTLLNEEGNTFLDSYTCLDEILSVTTVNSELFEQVLREEREKKMRKAQKALVPTPSGKQRFYNLPCRKLLWGSHWAAEKPICRLTVRKTILSPLSTIQRHFTVLQWVWIPHPQANSSFRIRRFCPYPTRS